jgi:dephospho-CoA kinase
MTNSASDNSRLSRHAPGLHIGLTGGIGSGKSTVGHILTGLGAHLVDTDAISRALTAAGGRAIPLVRAEFGDSVISHDGALDRQRMRELAFNDVLVRQRLEAILHPLIHDEPVVFDVPLLVESGHRWRERVDRILVVDCLQTTQIERVMQRSGWSRDMVERVIDQQATRAARTALADAVILNDGISLAELEHAVRKLWHDWGLSAESAR